MAFRITCLVQFTMAIQFLLILLITLLAGVLSDKPLCPNKETAETKLRKALLENYDYNIRPVCTYNKTITINVRMIVKSFTYDMHENLMTVNNWLPMSWFDDHLKWDPEDYEGIRQIHIPNDYIWTPDLSLYNRHDEEGTAAVITSISCLVTRKGLVVCVPPTKQEAHCKGDVSMYPFDTQKCSLRYGSWVHSGEEMNFTVQKPPYSLDNFIPNSEWELVKLEVTTTKGIFKCCPNNTYPSFYYHFTIKRHNGAHVATIFIPALVMAIMTLTVLWMDPRNTDRICVACCNVVCHVLYIQFISWELPYNSENTPLIILYARDALLMSTFALVLTVLLRGLTNSSSPGPVWISTVVDTIVKSTPGQAILYNYSVIGPSSEKNSRGDEAKIIDEDDTPTQQINSSNKGWILFAKVIDRLTFVAIFIAYACMFIAFVP